MSIFSRGQKRSEQYPISSLDRDSFAALFGFSAQNSAGMIVTESSSLGLTAVYRSVSIISGTIAGLPLKSYRDLKDGTRERTSTFLDSPHPEMTQFEWTETCLLHALLWGNTYLLHLYNQGGALAGLEPIHPAAVTVVATNTDDRARYGDFRKLFKVKQVDGSEKTFTPDELTHIPAMGYDGLIGLSPIAANRLAIGTGLAGNEAAGKMYSNGMLAGGLVSTVEDVTKDEAKKMKEDLDSRSLGVKNAGTIAFVNRNLKFTPWMMNPRDCQFIESRSFQVEEVSRIFGIPPHLLSQTEKQTSWGSGVAEQNLGLQKYTLISWTSRFEQRLSRLLPNKNFCEWDYAGLFRGTPRDEIELLALQVEKRLLTVNEARAIRNLPPVEGGDVLEGASNGRTEDA